MNSQCGKKIIISLKSSIWFRNEENDNIIKNGGSNLASETSEFTHIIFLILRIFCHTCLNG